MLRIVPQPLGSPEFVLMYTVFKGYLKVTLPK